MALTEDSEQSVNNVLPNTEQSQDRIRADQQPRRVNDVAISAPVCKTPRSLLQDVWHSAWHFWWCAAVPWGDLWRITCCEVFEFSEEFAGSHEKAGHDSAGC